MTNARKLTHFAVLAQCATRSGEYIRVSMVKLVAAFVPGHYTSKYA